MEVHDKTKARNNMYFCYSTAGIYLKESADLGDIHPDYCNMILTAKLWNQPR